MIIKTLSKQDSFDMGFRDGDADYTAGASYEDIPVPDLVIIDEVHYFVDEDEYSEGYTLGWKSNNG